MFKIGSEIVCIVPGSVGLTLYKKYKVLYKRNELFEGMVHIRNDRNESQSYMTFRFVTLSGYRKLKLKQLEVKK